MPKDCNKIVMSNKDAKESFKKMSKKIDVRHTQTLILVERKMQKKIKQHLQNINKDYSDLKKKVFKKICEETIKQNEVNKIYTDFAKKTKNDINDIIAKF
jgi:quinolinate synthase